MNEFNAKGQRHGPWIWYRNNGKLWSKGKYQNNNPIGI